LASINDLLAQHSALEGDRVNWDTLWQRVHDLNWPQSGNFNKEESPGQDRSSDIYDPTGTLALEKFGAVLESLLSPRNQRFHNMQPTVAELMKDKGVTEYFEKLTNLLFYVRQRPRSGFYDQAFESYKSLGGYGTQVMHVIPSKDRLGISYRHTHIGAVWIDTDDRGVIDTTFYRWKMTAKAAMQRWGEFAPESAIKAVEGGKPFQMLSFLHVVKPRKLVLDQLGPRSMPFESWEISVDSKEFIMQRNPVTGKLEESGGFRTHPYIVSRFSTNPSEKYGRSPSMFVLGANESLQRMEKTGLLYGEHGVAPPLLSQNMDILGDGSGRLDLRSAAVNPGWLDAQGNPRVKTLDNRFSFPTLDAMQEKNRNAINDAHFITLFQILVNSPEMTATEALIRAQEKGQLIAPMVGRQESEFLGPLIEREISVLASLDLLPELPPALVEAQGEYKVEYTGNASRIQREEEVQGIRATFVDVAAMAEVDPTVVEVLDAPAAVRFIANARNVPAHIINSEKEFEEIIAAQAAKAERDEALAAAPSLAKAAKDASSADFDKLSEVAA
jgi:hypothetical protein